MSLSIIPQEIKELIIGEVATFDYNSRVATLTACALAHSSLRDISQRHIFRQINVLDKKTYYRLENALLSRPRLGIHVEEFSVDEIRTVADQPSFPKMLATLQNLTMLSLCTFTIYDYDFAEAGRKMSTELQQTLEDLFNSPSLNTIFIGGLRNIPSVLAPSILNMEYVNLVSISFLSPDLSQAPRNPYTAITAHRKNVKSLRLSIKDAASLQPLINALTSREIELEEFAPYYERSSRNPFPDREETVNKIISSHKTSLTTLVFPEDGCFDIDIGEVPRLRNLFFTFNLSYTGSIFENIAKVLSTARYENDIQNVFIEVTSCSFSLEEATTIDDFIHGWELVDNLLTGSRFSNVRMVNVWIGKYSIIYEEEFKAKFACMLPRMKEKGILRIDRFTVESFTLG